MAQKFDSHGVENNLQQITRLAPSTVKVYRNALRMQKGLLSGLNSHMCGLLFPVLIDRETGAFKLCINIFASPLQKCCVLLMSLVKL